MSNSDVERFRCGKIHFPPNIVPQAEKCTAHVQQRKAIQTVFLRATFSICDFSLSGSPTWKLAPTPFSLCSISSRSRLFKPSSRKKGLYDSHWPGFTYLQNKFVSSFFSLSFTQHTPFFSVAQFCYNTPFLTIPETELSVFNHWCQLNLPPYSSYTCSRQSCWRT